MPPHILSPPLKDEKSVRELESSRAIARNSLGEMTWFPIFVRETLCFPEKSIPLAHSVPRGFFSSSDGKEGSLESVSNKRGGGREKTFTKGEQEKDVFSGIPEVNVASFFTPHNNMP